MVNITHKVNSLRIAVAQAVLKVSNELTIKAIKNKQVAKGDVFEFSRAAGLLAVKKTSDVIPDCHPLPIEYTAITHQIKGLEIVITVEVHTIYKTGVEVEAMHGASITVLTMYDMLKPIDKHIEIGTIKLLHKKGGKSDFINPPTLSLKCAVVVCSDSVAGGTKQDKAGKTIIEKLQRLQIETSVYMVIADETAAIQQSITQLEKNGCNLLLLTGGTGLSKRDVTPEAVEPLLTRPIPGIMETARNYGQQRMLYAMLSRGVAGFVNNMLVLTLPGSVRGVTETMDALFPHILHVFNVADGMRHDADKS